MKHSSVSLIIALAMATSCYEVAAQTTTDDDWVGVWHAETGSLHSATLTLAEDTGQIGGTFILDMIRDEGGQAYVVASEPHVLVSPHIANNQLLFQVKLRRQDGSTALATFEVIREGTDALRIQCTSCGPTAPAVSLIRGE
jgi:hypothetical protein